jgi:two-component system, NtrC family, sensor histidine kinase HydH
MRCQHLTVRALFVLVPLLLWAALADWQWHEYRHERELTQDTLRRQAESIEKALVGGIRSHRRFGPFFEEMTQGALNELASSKDILAVGIASKPETQQVELLLHAGKKELLETSLSTDIDAGRFVANFQLDLAPDDGTHGPGGGQGAGPGSGRGWGRGQRWQTQQDGPFSKGGRFVSILVLDQTQARQQCRHAFWLRVWVVVAGGVVLICAALAWLTTVRLMRARSRARVLELEARHLSDLSQAAAGLAHETRNPLGLVRGWTQRLAQSDLQNAQQQEQARAVVEECDRVTARINQFLSFARPSRPELEPVDTEQLIAELAVLLEPDLDAKELKLQHSVSKPWKMIRVDREMFRQALFNLIGNAIQFSPEKAVVEISIRTGQHGHGRIEVADRGPGVPAEAVDQLFSPYFTTRPDGTGLGLAIVRRIATAHGWEAGHEPRPGGGSIFWLDEIHGQ